MRMKETVVNLISKDHFDYVGNDPKFVDYVSNELTKAISERIIQALEESGEIIVKKPVLSVSEYPATCSVEYRKTAEWEPLVRCKECKHNTGTGFCEGRGWPMQLVPDDGFCDKGKRREENE